MTANCLRPSVIAPTTFPRCVLCPGVIPWRAFLGGGSTEGNMDDTEIDDPNATLHNEYEYATGTVKVYDLPNDGKYVVFDTTLDNEMATYSYGVQRGRDKTVGQALHAAVGYAHGVVDERGEDEA